MTVLSVGSICVSAEIIQRAGLRHASHPFDWLFCSVAAAIDIIETDFEHFLDPAFLKSLPNRDGNHRCLHSLYDGENRSRPMFAHRDPTIPEHRAYYERCIARFRSACATGATLMLFEEFGEVERRFDSLCAVIDRRYPACSLRAVRHVRGGLSVERIEARGKHELWRLSASPVTGGVRLERPKDEAVLMEAVCPTLVRPQDA